MKSLANYEYIWFLFDRKFSIGMNNGTYLEQTKKLKKTLNIVWISWTRGLRKIINEIND